MKHYSLSAIMWGLLLALCHFPAVADNKNASSSLLTFFREMAEGNDLSEPYGVGVNHSGMRQAVQVDSIRFSGMKLGSLPVDWLVDIRANSTRQKSHAETLQLPVFSGGAFPSGTTQDFRFRLNYRGYTYGAGMTLTGGDEQHVYVAGC